MPKKQNVDAIYYNAYIYSTNATEKPFSGGGIAILNDTILAFDSSHKVLIKYDSEIKEDLDEKTIYPKGNSVIEVGKPCKIGFK